MDDSIINIIIFALICVVMSGVINKFVPLGIIIPVSVLIGVCIWIGYDYFRVIKKNKTNDHDMNDLPDDLGNEKNIKNKDEQENKPTHVNEFDIDIYNGLSVEDIHRKMGSSGDNRLANRMKYMGIQSQLSKNIRSRYNKYNLLPFLEEEMQEDENRDWWINESEFLDELM